MKDYLNCVSCGILCQPGKRGDPKARPFKGASKGLCADCAVTQLFLSADFEALRIGILKNGIEVLKEPPIQRQFAKILRTGQSDLQSEEINWDRIIAQWDLPFPRGYKP